MAWPSGSAEADASQMACLFWTRQLMDAVGAPLTLRRSMLLMTVVFDLAASPFRISFARMSCVTDEETPGTKRQFACAGVAGDVHPAVDGEVVGSIDTRLLTTSCWVVHPPLGQVVVEGGPLCVEL